MEKLIQFIVNHTTEDMKTRTREIGLIGYKPVANVDEYEQYLSSLVECDMEHIASDISEILIARRELQKLGYDLTINQVYTIWLEYSNAQMASWLDELSNIKRSLPYLKGYSYSILDSMDSSEFSFSFGCAINRKNINDDINFLPLMPIHISVPLIEEIAIFQYTLSMVHKVDLSIKDILSYYRLFEKYEKIMTPKL